MALFKKGNTGGKGKSGKGKSSGKTGKSGNKSSGGSRLVPEERMASVLSESEPGTAIDFLSNNERFVLPLESGSAFVIMALYVQDPDFGGLGKRMSKNKTKGSIINFLVNDDIRPLITPDMLDNEILGIIPDQESLDRMNDFSVLQTARFNWAVVVPNPDTADLTVFSMPCIDPDSIQPELNKGLVYAEALEVISGEREIGDFISIELAGEMVEVLNKDVAPVVIDDLEDGLTNIESAEDTNLNLIKEMAKIGDYPSPEDFMANLAYVFSGEGNDPKARVREMLDGVGSGPEFDGAAGAHEEGSVADAPGVEDGVFDDDGDNDADIDGLDIPDVTADAEFDGDVPDDVYGDDGAEFDGGFPDDAFADGGADDSRAVLPVGQAGMSEDQMRRFAEMVGAETLEKLGPVLNRQSGQISDDPADVVEGTYNAYPADDVVAPGVDDRNFEFADVVTATVRQFVDDDLGIDITGDDLNAALRTPPLRIEVPKYRDQQMTPWLGEQYRDMVAKANTMLSELHRENYRSSVNQAVSLLSVAGQNISHSVNVNNPDGLFFNEFQMIESDRGAREAGAADLVVSRRNDARQSWDERKRDFVSAATEGAKAEFDRKYGSQITRELENVENKVQTDISNVTEQNLRSLNVLRRHTAREEMDRQMNIILSAVHENKVANDKVEAEVKEKLLAEINEFTESNRRDDIHHADVLEKSLAMDTRVEQIRADAADAIKKNREETAATVASVRKELEELRVARSNDSREHRVQLDNLTTAHEARIAEMTTGHDSDLARANARLEQVMAEVEKREAEAEKVKADAERDARAVIARNQASKTNYLWALIAIAVVMLVGGIALGMALG